MRQHAGFTYLTVMFLVFLLVLASSAAAIVGHIEARREKEKDLLFMGQQYAEAIASYHMRHEKSHDPYPTHLEQLLRDASSITVQRDLRRLYPDPMTGSPDWGLVKTRSGAIVGVYSLSSLTPIQRAHFPKDLDTFAGAKTYMQWVFRAKGSEDVRTVAPVSADAAPVAPTIPVAAAPQTQSTTADDTPVEVTPPIKNPAPGPNTSCAAMEANDQAICAQQYTRFGTDAGNVCSASAAARAADCATGQPYPNLYFRSH